MSRSRLTVVFGLALSACVSSVPSVPPNLTGKPIIYALSAPELSVVKRDVVKGLKDPESAILDDRILASSVEGDRSVHVCGAINAKNSLGGYTGRKPFYGVLSADRSFFVTMRAGGIDPRAVHAKCAEYGMVVYVL